MDTVFGSQAQGNFTYPDKTSKRIFYRKENTCTAVKVIKTGQVVKAGTFLESDVAGKLIAHLGAGAPIAGVTCYDVNATAADVSASVYMEGSFWANDDGTDFLVWEVDVLTDTIPLADGTTIAVTAYDTGAGGTTSAARLLKQKFVEGSEFSELGFLNAGDYFQTA